MKLCQWYLVAALLLCGSALAADRSFDKRAWSVGYDARDAEQHLTEYVVSPETVESWSELITHQVVADPTHGMELAKLASRMKSGFSQDCRKFKWKILKKSKSSLLYEWSHAGCSAYPPQYEVSLLSTCDEGVCRWAYATKRVPMDEDRRAIWRDVIWNLGHKP